MAAVTVVRYDAPAGQYVFPWTTDGLAPGTYRLRIELGNGTDHTVDVALR